MRNILVTGGAGFIGSHTVVELVSSGYNPIIIDDFSNSEKSVIEKIDQITNKEILLYEGLYQDSILLKKIMKVHKIHGVIHFAAYKAVGESVEKPLEYYENNVSGLVTLLNLVKDFRIPRFVFSSSCTVYGEPDSLPITEESPVKPANSPYGSTKQICETIIQDTVSATPSLKAISLRYFNPIGAHPSGLIGELPKGVPANLVPFITQTAAGIRDKVTIFGNDYPTEDGTCVRDYIHVVDLAKAHIKSLEYLDQIDTPSYDVCNVGTGKGNSVMEIINTFVKTTGKEVNYEIGPRRPGDTVSIYASVDKSKEILGWRTEKTLENALADAWRWQQTLTK